MQETMPLGEAVQTALDLYHGGVMPDDAEIGYEHVLRLFVAKYSEAVAAEYDRNRAIARAEQGALGMPEVSDAWLAYKVIELKAEGRNMVGEIDTGVYSFANDPYAGGVQSVRYADGCPCREPVRVLEKERWILCDMPATDQVYFYVERIDETCADKTRIVFVASGCHPKKVRIGYVPSLNEEGGVVSSRMVGRVTDAVLQTMFIAKGQVVIDKTNNSNPNTSPAVEVDTESVKNPQ